MSQRDYFKSDAVPKDNIVCSGWIDRYDMVNYKYVVIGFYDTLTDAKKAYNNYVILHKLNRKLKSI